MDMDRLCTELKLRVAMELKEANDPMARVEVLIEGLYDISRLVLPVLGTPRKGIEYEKAQGAVAELVSCLAIQLIRAGVGGERGVAVLSELAEGCRDPLLKKKLGVYALELLSRKGAPLRTGAILRDARSLFIIASCVVAAFVVYIVWPDGGADGKKPPQATAAVPAPQAGPTASTRLQWPPAAEVDATGERSVPLNLHQETRGAAAVAAAASPQGEQVTQVRIVNSQVLVPVTLKHGGASLRLELLLDTGSTRTALHESVAGRLPMDLRQAKSALAELADGRMVRSRVARLDLLSVGPFSHPSLEVELIAYGGSEGVHDGLLGMDVLGRHRYQIDMEHELIRWF